MDNNEAYTRVLELLSHKHARVYDAGEIIFSEGDIGDRIYFVLSGMVHIFTEQNKLKRSLSTLGAGEVFGEMALFNHMPRSASVEAKSDTKIVVLKSETFFTLMEKYPVLAMQMVRLMAERMHVMNTQLKQELGYHANTTT